MSIAAVNGIEIAYEVIGDGSRTVALLPGAGCQMLEWLDPFCEMIAEHDCRVVRVDTRDIGLSTKFDDVCPDPAAELEKAERGELVNAPYSLDDMADDTAALIAAISDGPAHVVGRSMGGMIGQRVAIRHPETIASLCSVASSAGNPEMPRASEEVMAFFQEPAPTDPEGAIRHAVDGDRLFTGDVFEFDEETGYKKRAGMRARADDSTGQLRHSLAFVATDPVAAYREHRAGLATLKLPVTVIHGSQDSLLNVANGIETAELIPGANLVIIEGMSHELPAGVSRADSAPWAATSTPALCEYGHTLSTTLTDTHCQHQC
ncbi:MAG: alpha/beta hydrolase [Dehalococcoidia bacterium]|nr:alpha/beta hydrolase [Dehalococcoidia bacterium]